MGDVGDETLGVMTDHQPAPLTALPVSGAERNHSRPVPAPAIARMRALCVALAVCLGLGFVAAGCGAADNVGAQANAGAGGGAGGRGQATVARTAITTLQSIPVRAATTSPQYRRDEFGTAWQDVDGNGCDTRNDILHRDLTLVNVNKNDSCIVLTGELKDPYTNRVLRFNRARAASAIQIDHVVALSDAWRTGAASWSPEKRVEFANDPENLLAVDGPTNQAKGDDDASEWLPPNQSFQCPYVARQIGVKARYGLWVETAERDAMRRVLAKCAG